jgi:hypothetical protein
MSRRMQLPSESWQLQAPGAPLPTRRTTRATAAALPAASDLSACLRALGGDFTEVGSALGAHHDAEMWGCGADLEAALALSLETDAPNAATASAHASAVVPEALGTADKLPRRSKKARLLCLRPAARCSQGVRAPTPSARRARAACGVSAWPGRAAPRCARAGHPQPCVAHALRRPGLLSAPQFVGTRHLGRQRRV